MATGSASELILFMQAAANTMHDIEAQNGTALVSSITSRLRLALLSPEAEGRVPCIYKIPKQLQGMNEKSYTPMVVSLGPYTHGMKGLEFMENVKLRYLQTFLDWSGTTIEDLVMFTREREAKARACYASLINFDSDEFVEIILVDATFILVTLLKHRFNLLEFSQYEHGNCSFDGLRHDFGLLENQLPLFVLVDLFEKIRSSERRPFSLCIPGPSVNDLAFDFLKVRMLNEGVDLATVKGASESSHFVDLLRLCHIPSLPVPVPVPCDSGVRLAEPRDKVVDASTSIHLPSVPVPVPCDSGDRLAEPAEVVDASTSYHFFDLTLRLCHIPSVIVPVTCDSDEPIIRKKSLTLTNLHEAGVKFKEPKTNKKWVDIKFTNGVLEIPYMRINDNTETILRNIAAFEQCHSTGKESRYITDYIIAMAKLVNTSKDAEILAEKGILLNDIGQSEHVANLFYRLDKDALYDAQTFYYAGLFKKLDSHCEIRYNKWRASLKHDYCNSPWQIASSIAALILLLFTFAQTVIAIYRAVVNKGH